MDEFYGAKAATKDLHPIIEISAENCTPQMGVTRTLVRKTAPF